MRKDQFDSLQKRAEELTDLFLKEANPAAWPGQGIEDANMDAKTRGDRYWVKKNAFATMSLVQRILGVIDVVRKKSSNPDAEGAGSGAAVEDDGEELENEVASAERLAKKMLKKATTSAQKTVAHGKS